MKVTSSVYIPVCNQRRKSVFIGFWQKFYAAKSGQAYLGTAQSAPLGSAVLDVFEAKTIPQTSPLWSVPGLVITPHTSAEPERFRRWILIRRAIGRSSSASLWRRTSLLRHSHWFVTRVGWQTLRRIGRRFASSSSPTMAALLRSESAC
ncbi:NAD(P)-dependent oxidoreductase [Thalassococcus sp. S3]|uniref:NAD(P)-dependent oxidoreductase n=1 Tax=Thalassococcus sp. S3 TaxID=2017482 RepID=UPI00102C6379